MALRTRICRLDEVVDGALRGFRVRGVTWPVLVTRVDGEVIASAGVCPHEDVALEDGELDGCVLTCPGHAYQFDLRTGACTHDAGLRLRRYRVTIVDDEVWADLL
ncbi:MAG: Rieske 2Fe-2S domain-containing protein [Kofleriaceae bacterium]|jgi:nitrite reductase/ring-hydroxylating ferredoxin subunit|nr:Rieske 2Fe-2S domain-containing protein [Kofleriaceae bacterium]